MSNKAVFLDRDGTINVDYGYVYKPENFKFIDGAIEALKLLQSQGFLLIIVTNQSGIGRGMYTEADFLCLHKYIDDILIAHDVKIDGLYYCPHIDQNCECRKPGTKLFYDAAREHNIDFSKSYAVGDHIRDLSICKFEPVRGILINDTEIIQNNRITYSIDLITAAHIIVK